MISKIWGFLVMIFLIVAIVAIIDGCNDKIAKHVKNIKENKVMIEVTIMETGLATGSDCFQVGPNFWTKFKTLNGHTFVKCGYYGEVNSKIEVDSSFIRGIQ